VRARDHRGLALTFHFWRTKEGEEIDFLIEAHGPRGPRWIAIEAKLAIQNVAPIEVPRALSKLLPSLSEIWIVTAGGVETRLSGSSIVVPIRDLADKLEGVLHAE
jgi:hypothetical protein